MISDFMIRALLGRMPPLTARSLNVAEHNWRMGHVIGGSQSSGGRMLARPLVRRQSVDDMLRSITKYVYISVYILYLLKLYIGCDVNVGIFAPAPVHFKFHVKSCTVMLEPGEYECTSAQAIFRETAVTFGSIIVL